MDLTRLALTGLVAGLAMAACDNNSGAAPEPAPAAAAPTPEAAPAPDAVVASAGPFTELHDCSGKNTCKGLGGCKVTAEQLEQMAAAMGVEAVAQTYSGTPATSMASMAAQPESRVPSKKPSGTATTIVALMAKPTMNQGVRSSSSVPKA